MILSFGNNHEYNITKLNIIIYSIGEPLIIIIARVRRIK